MLALKGNQGTLSADVELFFAEQKARNFKDTVISRHRTLGRIETRTYTATSDIAWLAKSHPGWKGLKSIVMVESMREIVGGNTEHETSFYSPPSAPMPSGRARRSAATGASRTATTWS